MQCESSLLVWNLISCPLLQGFLNIHLVTCVFKNVFSASFQPDDGQCVGSFSTAVGRSALHSATIEGHVQIGSV